MTVETLSRLEFYSTLAKSSYEVMFLNILKAAEEAGRNFRAGASASTRGDSRFIGTARAGVTELSSVGEDFTPISNGLRDGDAVFSKNSARLGLNTDSVK